VSETVKNCTIFTLKNDSGSDVIVKDLLNFFLAFLAALGVLPLFRALSLSLFFINIMAAALFNALKCI
jgi:hypothetical protein